MRGTSRGMGDTGMRQKTFQVGVVRHLVIALILALCLVPINSSPVFALSVAEYFSYTYEVTISQAEVQGSEVFYATAIGQATCTKDLPLPVSTAQITSRIIAEHQVTGAEVILNPSYTITIDPFPNKKGDTSQESVSVPLAFPAGSESGTYNVIGQLVEAQVYSLVVWVDVTDYLPSSEAAGSVTYLSSGGGGDGDGDGGVTPPTVPGLPAGTTDISDFVSDEGIFSETVVVESFDGKIKVTIPQNTTGLTEEGDPLSEVSMIAVETPPPPPADANVIGLVYDFGPDRATFDQPITISLAYNKTEIPADVAEENLVIAVWDEETGQWVTLVSTVDPVNNIVTTEVTHFTSYTILAYTRPTGFTVSSLTISFRELEIGEEVIISVLVTNTGDLEDTHQVTLKINDVAIDTKEVALAGGASETVTFTTSQDAGTYTVSVGGQSGTFAVSAPVPPIPPTVPVPLTPAVFTVSDLAISPDEVEVGETVTIGVLVTNTGDLEDTHQVTLKIDNVAIDTKEVTLAGGASETVTFVTSQDVTGTYTVSVATESRTLAVKEAAAAPKPFNWWLVVGIIAVGIAVGVGIVLVVRRRFGWLK